MEPGAIEQAWVWVGREIAAFGLRWLVVGVLVLAFSGCFGKRYRDMKSQLSTLEAARAQPSQTINVNIGDIIARVAQDVPSHHVPKRRVAEYIPNDKIIRVGTKNGAMEIRLSDEEKTVEDVLQVLSKLEALKSLDDCQ